jgi:hypothetical protein
VARCAGEKVFVKVRKYSYGNSKKLNPHGYRGSNPVRTGANIVLIIEFSQATVEGRRTCKKRKDGLNGGALASDTTRTHTVIPKS